MAIKKEDGMDFQATKRKIFNNEKVKKKEKITETMTNKRDKSGIDLRKTLAKRLFNNKITIEKMGNKNNEEALPNCDSPQGKE